MCDAVVAALAAAFITARAAVPAIGLTAALAASLLAASLLAASLLAASLLAASSLAAAAHRFGFACCRCPRLLLLRSLPLRLLPLPLLP